MPQLHLHNSSSSNRKLLFFVLLLRSNGCCLHTKIAVHMCRYQDTGHNNNCWSFTHQIHDRVMRHTVYRVNTRSFSTIRGSLTCTIEMRPPWPGIKSAPSSLAGMLASPARGIRVVVSLSRFHTKRVCQLLFALIRQASDTKI